MSEATYPHIVIDIAMHRDDDDDRRGCCHSLPMETGDRR